MGDTAQEVTDTIDTILADVEAFGGILEQFVPQSSVFVNLVPGIQAIIKQIETATKTSS